MTAPATTSLNYETVQNFNPLTRWLHGYRYRHALDALADIPQPFSVLEIGTATGKLFGALAERYQIDYTGIEPYEGFAAQARARYGNRPNFRLLEASATPIIHEQRADVVIALETFEHILEREVVTIVDGIAAMSPKLFIASVPVELGPAILMKNLGSFLCGYRRHREYGWRRTLAATFNRLDSLPPHGSSHMGFDWRWLAQTIRHRFKILEMRRFPFAFLPASCSATVFMICRPWTEAERPRVT